jgi:hypothetical protein
MIKATRANSFNTGMAAEYFVLSQLFRMGLEAYLSQGNKKSIDIRVVHNANKSISIDVKAVRGYSSLVVNNVRAEVIHVFDYQDRSLFNRSIFNQPQEFTQS